MGEWWRRLRALVWREQLDRDLEEEMRLHRELRARALTAKGIDAVTANSTAHRTFGNRTRWSEASRDVWGFGSLDAFRTDLRYALRRLRQRPGFSLAVISVMTLGIGATTAMFSAVDAAFLRPLPFAQPDRLVVLPYLSLPYDQGAGDRAQPADNLPTIVDAMAMTDQFANVAAYAAGGLNLSDPERPLRARVGVVTDRFFATLGISPTDGRGFLPEDGRPAGTHVAVLSDRLWRVHYGGRPMLDQDIQLNGTPYRVIGIMPARFSFPDESDLWIPLTIPTTRDTYQAFRGYLPTTVIARLAPGATLTGASARMVTRWIQGETPPEAGKRFPRQEQIDADIRAHGAVQPLQVTLVGDHGKALLVLLGATVLLLMIACANVTNLLLSQAAARRREIAVRAVLGATRGRVIRQLLTESVLLATVGAGLGVAVAPVVMNVMRSLMPAELAGIAPATLDLRVLTFAALLGLGTGIGFGIWPAFGTIREAPAETIKSGGGHGATAGTGRHLRRLLVTLEVALTILLLVGAGLMLHSFRTLMVANRGLDTDRVATLELAFTPSAGGRADRLARIDAILARMTSTPGITAAGVVNDLPMSGNGGISIMVDVPGATTKRLPFARYLLASDGYFPSLGIPLMRGRNFRSSDDSLAPPVALVSQAMARSYWPGSDPLGRTFLVGGDSIPTTVIGVVADVRETITARDTTPQMYFSVYRATPATLTFVARGTLPPAEMLSRIASAVHAVDRSQAIIHLRMMDEVVGASAAPQRTNTRLITAFACLALLLAAIGVYAVVSYGVAERSREFGIRVALGARGPDLLRLLTMEMAWVVLIGGVIGLGGSWALARIVESLLFGVDVHDATTFLLVPLVIVVTTLVATLLPASRALRVSPAEIIRND